MLPARGGGVGRGGRGTDGYASADLWWPVVPWQSAPRHSRRLAEVGGTGGHGRGGTAVAGPPWYRLVLTTPVSGLTADDRPELGRGGPRWPGVDHAVAVGAEQGKIADVPGAFPANVQRLDVVAFDMGAALLKGYLASGFAG